MHRLHIQCDATLNGNAAAMGYSLESGIPYGQAFVKNTYVGRTFIKPKQSMRRAECQDKN